MIQNQHLYATSLIPFENRLRYPIKMMNIATLFMTLNDRVNYHQVPGVSIAVLDEGKIIWAKGYGVKDISTQQTVNENTLFQACSISKMITAFGVLLLVQDGILDLDTDVNVYLKRWQAPKKVPYQNELLTLRRLLSHTGGITVPGVMGYTKDEKMPTVLEFLNGVKPLSKSNAVEMALMPGNFNYSGGGTTIVEIVIEDITGLSFSDYIKKNVFAPLNMTRSFFMRPLPKDEKNFATGHDHEGKPMLGKYCNYPTFAAAGLWTTPLDLIQLGLGIQQSLINKGILSSKLAQEMITPQEFSEITGIGTFIRGDRKVFGHSGSNPGMRCFANFTTDSQKGVVIMTNGDNGEELGEELLCSVYDTYNWPLEKSFEKERVTISSSILDSHAGDYWFTVNKGTPHEKTILGCVVKVEKDHLSIQRLSSNDPQWATHFWTPWTPFFPETDLKYFNLYGLSVMFDNTNQFKIEDQIYFKRV